MRNRFIIFLLSLILAVVLAIFGLLYYDRKEITITESVGSEDSAESVGSEDSGSPVAPSFAVAKPESGGKLLIAGRATPHAVIELHIDGKRKALIPTNNEGDWVYVSDEPLPAGDARIEIRQIKEGNVIPSKETLYITVPHSDSEGYIAVLVDNESGSGRFLHRSDENIGRQAPALSLVDYDSNGHVIFRGRGQPEHFINLYLNNKFIGRQTIDKDGRWLFKSEENFTVGTYALRLDMTDSQAEIIGRTEFPFHHSDESIVVSVNKNSYRIVVQPGNSLWHLARSVLGKGSLYTVIYYQNYYQIHDPDLIYPGQVLEFSHE